MLAGVHLARHTPVNHLSLLQITHRHIWLGRIECKFVRDDDEVCGLGFVLGYLVEGPVTYDFTLYLRICDYMILEVSLNTFFWALTISWSRLMCEVAFRAFTKKNSKNSTYI